MASAVTINDILRTIPENVVAYLNPEQREELAKFTKELKQVSVSNDFDGTTTIDTIADDFVSIKLNDAVDMQLRLLPTGDTTRMICLVWTATKPVKESVVKFYASDWSPIDEDFNLPDATDSDLLLSMFVHRPDTMAETTFNELCKYVEPVMLWADFSHSSDIITLSLSMPFVSKDKRSGLSAIIKKKCFKWNGKTFNEY